jgi:long-chain acyl-CoA synthetase
MTFREFYQECRHISYGLMALGIEYGHKVAILSNTRIEWSLSDMAILGARGVTVPIYASNHPQDIVYITHHAEAQVLFLEDGKQLKKIIDQETENPNCLPTLKKIVVFDPAAMRTVSKNHPLFKNILTLQALQELGKREEAKDPTRFDRNLIAAKPQDLVTICYTSGTTGTPKGVMLNHDHFMSVMEDCTQMIGPIIRVQESVLLSFLPFSHVIGKVESLAIHTFGWVQAFAGSIDQLMIQMGEVQPTLIFSVPRIFEKAYSQIMLTVENSSPIKKQLFHWALHAGQAYYAAIHAHKPPSLKTQLNYKIAKTVVFQTILKKFGGRLQYALCGGAPLPKAIGEFFQIIGITILEGYGLTETSAPITLNSPEHLQFGTVGRALPEVSLQIAEDGEILVKSRKVFTGYYKMPKETAEVLRSGWFYTGDLGHIDADGFLHITDRKKDLIITSGGKNIAPQKIEAYALSQKLIQQLVVHGDRRHYLTALLTLHQHAVIQYANENRILFSQYSELIKNPKIIALTQKTIDQINQHLAHFETIKKFFILPNEFTIESGELTPSLKIKRSFINKKYKVELDSMYASTP